MRRAAVLVLALAAACGSPATPRTSEPDAAPPPSIDAAPDADPNACAPFGAAGECMSTTACAALGDHSSYPGYCAGPTDIQCCIDTPDLADNPPIPAGYRLMMQSEVTTEMTTWAVDILHDPVTYPMYATTMRVFGTQTVLARVEWHPPDFNNGVIHRGVTLYVPL